MFWLLTVVYFWSIKQSNMISQNIPLVSWSNGTVMIGVFALVCVGLVVALLLLINSGSKKKES